MTEETVWYYPLTDEIVIVSFCLDTWFCVVEYCDDKVIIDGAYLAYNEFIKLGNL